MNARSSGKSSEALRDHWGFYRIQDILGVLKAGGVRKNIVSFSVGDIYTIEDGNRDLSISSVRFRKKRGWPYRIQDKGA